MNRTTPFLVAVVTFFCVGQALSTPEYQGIDLTAVLKQKSRPTCRAALSECLRDIDSGKKKECDTLPVPRGAFIETVTPGTFILRELRKGVWSYFDGIYFSLILKKGKRLALVDFPDAATSNKDTGSGTLLTDAIEQVIKKTIPTRIDMVYSHAHLDHIGGATRVFNYAQKRFPKARFFVWGTEETKKLIDVHTTDRAVPVNVVVKEPGLTLELSKDLKVKLMIVGGHTQQDLVALIPKRRGESGIAFYVDVVFPKWSPPFNLAITQDLREMIAAQKEILKLDFDILVPGHLKFGTKKDIRVNIRYLEDLLETSKKVLDSVTQQQLLDAGIAKLQDRNAREFGNVFYGFVVTRRLEIDACYRALIEKWGCRLAALDLFLRGHCFIALTFVLTDI